MNNEFLDIIDKLSEKRATSFMNKTKAVINLKTDIEQVIRDTSWIEKLEETIPYIDAIVRNPRKFIVQEEEIIPVEKTRKVTEESIKHLAKHTSLIQDVDENGDVMPLKLLNVFKEETTDLYENRFIYSLIVNTKTFLNDQLESGRINQKSKYQKVLNYSSETVLSGEKVNYKLEIINEFSENKEEEALSLSVEERIRRIGEIFDDFLRTKFIKELNGSTPVRSPIRKTNVILKDKNFIKGVELWEFLEKYNVEEATKVVTNSKEEKVDGIRNDMLLTSYLQYYFSVNNDSKEKTREDNNFSISGIRKIIEQFVKDSNLTEKQFKSILNKEFKDARSKKEILYNEIKQIYKSNFITHQEKIKNALLFLD